MNLRRKIRQFPEAFLVCAGFVIIPFLPRFIIIRTARFLGWAGYLFGRRLRIIANANLEAAFKGELSDEEKKRIIRSSMSSFATVALDYFWFGVFTRRRVARYVKADPSFNHYYETFPCIAVTGHMGNWEAMGVMSALNGYPLTSVAAPIDNPVVDRMVNRLRTSTGASIVKKDGAVKHLIRVLKNNGKVALLVDQNTHPRDGGEFVDFFGLKVPISKIVSSLAERTGAKMVFAYSVMDEKGCYICYALPPVDVVSESLKGLEITQRIASLYEEVIRKYPGSWLWTYRRWNYIPDDGSPDGYPFYSRKVSEPRKIW